MTDPEAVAYADKSVRQSQGSGREKDLSAIQSPNNEAMRFWTMFYTPWNVMFNAQWQGTRAMKRGNIRPMIAVTWWWLVVQMLGSALLGGDWPDWKDDKSIEGWAARNVFFGMFAGIPLARDAANFMNAQLSGQYASDVGTTPITRVADQMEKAWAAGKRKVVKDEDPKRPIKQVADLTAILFGLPLSQIGTSAQFAWDVHQGEADPQSISDWYFGITRGRVPEKTDEAAS